MDPNKILEHGAEALARSGSRAIGSFVRAWLCLMACAVAVIAYADMTDKFNLHPSLYDSLLVGVIMAVVCWSLPVAVVVAIATIAVKF